MLAPGEDAGVLSIPSLDVDDDPTPLTSSEPLFCTTVCRFPRFALFLLYCLKFPAAGWLKSREDTLEKH